MSAVNASLYPAGYISPTGQVLKSPDYGYLVTESVCIVFMVLYGITTALHLIQAIHFRMWWLLPTAVLAGAGEVLGWSARLWSSISPLLITPFTIQISATIIAPTPFVAAILVTFARIIERLGVRYSRLTPRWYSRFFFSCDLISLFVQAAGGGIASSASTDAGSTLGGNIMLGGIIFQLVSLILFICIATETLVRFWKDLPAHEETIRSSDSTLTVKAKMGHRITLLLYALSFITTCIFIRSIYRTIELADGWNGRIIETQIYFNALDGGMVVISMFTFNIFHPGWFLKPAALDRYADFPLDKKEVQSSHLVQETSRTWLWKDLTEARTLVFLSS